MVQRLASLGSLTTQSLLSMLTTISLLQQTREQEEASQMTIPQQCRTHSRKHIWNVVHQTIKIGNENRKHAFPEVLCSFSLEHFPAVHELGSGALWHGSAAL